MKAIPRDEMRIDDVINILIDIALEASWNYFSNNNLIIWAAWEELQIP